MDIKSYAKNKKQSVQGEQDIKDKIDELSKKNENELMRELSAAVEAGKKDGSFSKSALSDFVSKVSPMLNAEQKARLKSLTDSLK